MACTGGRGDKKVPGRDLCVSGATMQSKPDGAGVGWERPRRVPLPLQRKNPQAKVRMASRASAWAVGWLVALFAEVEP